MLLYRILDSKSSYWGADSAVECGQEVIGKGSSKDKLFKQVQLEDAAGGTNGIKISKVSQNGKLEKFQKFIKLIQLVIAVGRDDARLVVMAKKWLQRPSRQSVQPSKGATVLTVLGQGLCVVDDWEQQRGLHGVGTLLHPSTAPTDVWELTS